MVVKKVKKIDSDSGDDRSASKSTVTSGSSYWSQKARLIKIDFLLANTAPSVHGSLFRKRRKTCLWRANSEMVELRGSTLIIYKTSISVMNVERQVKPYMQLEEIAGATDVTPYVGNLGNGAFPFKIALNSKRRILHFAAESDEMRSRWIKHLNDAKVVLGPQELKFISTIGAGHFGKVVLAIRQNPNGMDQHLAVKEIKLDENDTLRGALTERLLLANLPIHPFVITLQMCFRHGNYLYYGFDFKPGADLFEFMKRHKLKMDFYGARFYMTQIVMALQHLHVNQIVYRDLKPENVLVDEKGYLCLADLGLSKRLPLGGKTYSICGTRPYLAPEMIDKNIKGYDYSVDYWQLGCFLYELFAGRSPFWISPRKCQPQIEGGETAAKILAGEFSRPKRIDDRSYHLACRLLALDTAKRLGSSNKVPPSLSEKEKRTACWAEVRCHPFFESVDWDMIYSRKVIPPCKPHPIGELSGKCLSTNFNTRFLEEEAKWGADLESFTNNVTLYREELSWFNWIRPTSGCK